MTTTTTNPTATTPLVRNGLNLTRLGQTVEAIAAQPSLADFTFRLDNRWTEGGQNQATVGAFHGADQEFTHDTTFTVDMDEPDILLGTDTGANPVEVLLAALSGCMTTSLAYHAAAHGLTLEAIESHHEGDLDLRGFLAMDPAIRPGYREIRVKFRVKGEGEAAQLKQLMQLSPVYNVLTQGTKVVVDLEVV